VALDFLVTDELTSRDENFWDLVHYRHPVAHVIEDRLAAALAEDAAPASSPAQDPTVPSASVTRP
jgi:hypothetical protein